MTVIAPSSLFLYRKLILLLGLALVRTPNSRKLGTSLLVMTQQRLLDNETIDCFAFDLLI
jgi:hypothetical protein